MILLARIFPEIAIKSRPVRKRFTQRLCRNIKTALLKFDEEISVKSLWDKVEITTELTDPLKQKLIIKKLQQIPGIQNFSIVESYPLPDIKKMYNIVQPFYQEKLNNRSFAVRVKRNGDHPFSSLDVEREIGRLLLEDNPTSSVNLNDPEITVRLEIKDDILYVYQQEFNGTNGYPVGVQEHVLSLISGGFDSSVSSYLMMQNGCKVDYLFFNLGGYAHEIGVKEVSKYISESFSDGYNGQFISVNFEPVIDELMSKVTAKYRGVMLKRCMLRVAEMINTEGLYQAIVTGESLGQVSSQTLVNLNVISQVTDQMLFRPLLTMQKQDIIEIAKQIGTEEFANHIPEYCAVVSSKPSTAAKLETILEEEQSFDSKVLQQVFDERKVINIKQFKIENNADLKVETTSQIAHDDIVIDVRDEENRDEKPFDGHKNQLEIPYYKLTKSFEKLDQKNNYLLYCDNGTTSRLLALNLLDKGYTNVKVLHVN